MDRHPCSLPPLRPSAPSVRLMWGQGQHCEVVGGHVAPAAPSHLHQAPLGVPAFVPRLQDPDRLPGTNGHFVFASGAEVKGCKDLEETEVTEIRVSGPAFTLLP